MHPSSNDLLRTVEINEQVKRVIAISGRVRSIANNAIPLAHRAGQAARGFNVVSNELSTFSDEVIAQMAILSKVTYRLVAEVSVLLKRRRQGGLLSRAHARLQASKGDSAMLDRALTQQHHDCDQSAQRIGALRANLSEALDATDRLGQYGSVLARTALIEAVHGGSYSESLLRLAQEFNATITQIIDAMRDTRRASNYGVPATPQATA